MSYPPSGPPSGYPGAPYPWNQRYPYPTAPPGYPPAALGYPPAPGGGPPRYPSPSELGAPRYSPPPGCGPGTHHLYPHLPHGSSGNHSPPHSNSSQDG